MFSCTNSDIQFDENNDGRVESNVSNRSLEEYCTNLIENSSFTSHNPNTDCLNGFADGAVHFWSNAYGTPDFLHDGCTDWFNNIDCDAHPEYASLACNADTSYTEGIMTAVDIVDLPNICYVLCFDGVGPDYKLLNIALENNVISPGQNFVTQNNFPAIPPDQIIFSSTLLDLNGCDTKMPSYRVEFDPNMDYSQIVLFPSNEIEFPGGNILIDNITLHCESKCLEGISDIQDECKFIFSPILSCEIPGASYYWDFGDGNGADGQNVEHVYEDGTYTVTLNIVDDNDCCTKVTKLVSCNVVPPSASCICWSTGANSNAVNMQAADVVLGVNYIDPNGFPGQLLLDSPIAVESSYFLILSEINILVESINGLSMQSYSHATCFKGNNQVPGYTMFNFNDFEFVGLEVIFDPSSGGGQGNLPFPDGCN